MRLELQAKFIQYLNQTNSERGFTLVELLVVTIIVGIIAAFAIPNILSQSAKAKQSEAKQNIGMVNRVQSAHRAQNSQFASSFDLLAIGTLTGGNTATTSNYSYTLNAGIETATIVAQATNSGLKGYSGATNRHINSSNFSVIVSVICEASSPGTTAPIEPNFTTTASPVCVAPYISN